MVPEGTRYTSTPFERRRFGALELAFSRIAGTWALSAGDLEVPVQAQRPPVLIAMAVCSIALGLLGITAGCCGMLNPLLTAASTEMIASNPMLQQQAAMQQELLDAQQAFVIPQVLIALFNMTFSTLLVVGTGLLLSSKRVGQPVYLAAAIGCAVVDLATVILGGVMQWSMRDQLAAVTTAGAPEAAALGGAMMRAGFIGGLVLAGVIFLVKLGVYGFGVWVSRRQDVSALLA